MYSHGVYYLFDDQMLTVNVLLVQVLVEMSKYDVQSSISDDDETGLYSLIDPVTGGLRDWWRSWWPNTEYPQSFRVRYA